MLTGTGYLINAWFVTVFFTVGAIGCLVLVPLAVGSLHKHADSKSNSIGLIVLCVLGALLFGFLAWALSRNVGRRSSIDSVGIRGLAVTQPARNRFEKSVPKVERVKGVTPWPDVDHVERAFHPGAEGGGTYGIHVHLKDGRVGRAYVWSARASTMDDLVNRLEAVRQCATRRESGLSAPSDERGQ